MRHQIGKRRRRKLLRELARGERDVWSIAEAYRLSLEELVCWADEPENERVLSALRKLSNQQAQTTLSKYRSHAAARLASLAMGVVKKEDDVTRRTCMDVLKTRVNEPPASAPAPEGSDSGRPGDGGIDAAEVLRAIDAAARLADEQASKRGSDRA